MTTTCRLKTISTDGGNMQQPLLDQILGCPRFTEMLNSEVAKKIVPVKPQAGDAGLAKALRDINSQNPWETATRFSRGEK